ncbi:carbohydrate ABC transporter permease [Cohnella cholangitidis]|uniref:Maltose/maltodextrin transport system permease protein n=1 Tax=Cohnella cholangitidis TaxID=2598458 RepID=A0A7G5BUJ0_9BACL|nr:sugar ABC transporter permease [Cohnella cholangitidis]QMV40624.1 sugar ABC transporter permease [Cohnella cholangitidis]
MTKHTPQATLLSVLFMGLGQWYNRQFVKGLLFALVEIAGIYWIATRLATSVRGLITLGDTPRGMVKIGREFKPVAGDHSIFMMVEGLIALIFVLLFLFVYFLCVRDARITALNREKGIEPPSFGVSWNNMANRNFPYFILAIPITAAVLFTVMPIIFTVLVAFTDFAAPNLPPAKLVNWIGFDTFKNLLNLGSWSNTLIGVAAWTVFWSIAATLTTYMLGTVVAVLIHQKGIRLKTFWRTMLVIPFAVPNLVSLLVFRNLLNEEFGPINQYLEMLGLGGIPWLNDPTWARITVIAVNLWLGFPLIMILVSGILTTISKDLYEAAEVDGASRFFTFRVITFPLVLFSTAPILITQFASNFNNFNVIFLLTNGNPVMPDYIYAGGTDLLVTWLYKLTLTNNQYNFASVLSILVFIFIASISILNFRKTRSFKEEDLIQ